MVTKYMTCGRNREIHNAHVYMFSRFSRFVTNTAQKVAPTAELY